MPLTQNEFFKLTKAIFHGQSMNINGQNMLTKRLVLDIINDYCDKMSCTYTEEDDKYIISYKSKE